MNWSGLTPVTYPCFVVWTTKANGTRKERPVVDLKALNKITLPDAYPMPSQADIFASLQGATHITIVHCLIFFYWWRVKPDQKH